MVELLEPRNIGEDDDIVEPLGEAGVIDARDLRHMQVEARQQLHHALLAGDCGRAVFARDANDHQPVARLDAEIIGERHADEHRQRAVRRSRSRVEQRRSVPQKARTLAWIDALNHRRSDIAARAAAPGAASEHHVHLKKRRNRHDARHAFQRLKVAAGFGKDALIRLANLNVRGETDKLTFDNRRESVDDGERQNQRRRPHGNPQHRRQHDKGRLGERPRLKGKPPGNVQFSFHGSVKGVW